MNKYVYTLGGIIILVASYLVMKPKPVLVETALLQSGVFDETLAMDGKVRSRNKKTVYATAAGNLQALQLKLGDLVKKGQPITRLEWDRTTSIQSPMDGVLTKIYRDSAGPIARGEPIFEVSDVDDLEVVSEILTPDAVRLQLGSEAKILNWGGEGELHAKISQVSKAGSVKVSALGVEEERTEVKLKFEAMPVQLKEKLGDNYHVDVVFLISREKQVLTVPLGALFKRGDSWAVYVVQDGRALAKDIQISKRNERQAVVVLGLSEGEEVLLFPGDKIRDGVSVKSITR